MNKKMLLTAVLSAVVFGAIAYSAPTRNNRAGAQLTYALNGSLRWVASTTTATDAGFTQLTGWEDGAMAYTYCDVATYQVNAVNDVTYQADAAVSDAGNVQIARAVPVAAATLYPVGVLRAGTSYVHIASQASGGAACRGFVSE